MTLDRRYQTLAIGSGLSSPWVWTNTNMLSSCEGVIFWNIWRMTSDREHTFLWQVKFSKVSATFASSKIDVCAAWRSSLRKLVSIQFRCMFTKRQRKRTYSGNGRTTALRIYGSGITATECWKPSVSCKCFCYVTLYMIHIKWQYGGIILITL